MRLSQLFTKTTKNVPGDETARNAKLLIQAGYVNKEMAGVYSFLPLGKRVLDNITNIVREEMNAIGGQELQLSVLQSKELWEKTDRWDDEKVDVWFKAKLRAGGEVGLAATNEEPLTELLHNYVNSYKDLPLLIYQIQTKFRNELRAKSGIMRGREFLMKDLYSFSRTEAEHQALYDKVTAAYHRVFERLGIADKTYLTFASGGIFSKYSHEFQTLTEAGEDRIFLDKTKKVAVNEEVMNPAVLKELGLKKDDLQEVKAAEVGNIFTLSTKFSKPLNLTYVDEDGNEQLVLMGCYGIGISRIMGVMTELLSDDRGLVWPENIAPFKVYLARLGAEKEVVTAADKLYKDLTEAGIEVLYDDRDLRPGEKFADADLIGIPYRVVVSEKTCQAGKFELKPRTEKDAELVDIKKLLLL